MTAVWFYLSSSKDSERQSMLHSIRLAQKNLTGVSNWVVVGDKPPVDSVEWLRCPRISETEYRKQTGLKINQKRSTDVVWKCLKAIESSKVADRFLWLHDDHFILKPAAFEELFRRRSRGTYRPSDVKQTGWRELKRQTFLELQNRNLPNYDYSDHQIIGMEKSKLQATIDEFKLMEKALLLESLYGNHHCSKPELLESKWFRYITCANEWPEKEPVYINLQNGRWLEHRERITNHQLELIK